MSNPFSPRSLGTSDGETSQSINVPTPINMSRLGTDVDTGRDSQNSTRSSRYGRASRFNRSGLSEGQSPRMTKFHDAAAQQRVRLKSLAKYTTRASQNNRAELLRSQSEKDNLQSRLVGQARQRRQEQMKTLSKSIQYAKAKQTPIDMASEVEQEKFFNEEFEDEVQPEVPAPEIEEEIEDDLDIALALPTSTFKLADVVSMSWTDKMEEETANGIYVMPGQEAANVPPIDFEAIRKERELDGLFVGSEPVISSNLRAWLTRDGWMENGMPDYLEDTVYSYPVRTWTLPFGTEMDVTTKEPRAYLASEPLDDYSHPIPSNTEPDEACYELCIHIHQLKFTSHYLMSTEHVMQVTLVKIYENYVKQGMGFFYLS